MLQILDPICEYRNNPVGIDTPLPRFSWKLASDQRDVLQISYRLQVSPAPDFQSLLWDSGVVESGASQFVPYSGPALSPLTRYYYRVSAADNHGETSAFSPVCYFETAFLNSEEFKAEFISAQDDGPHDYTSAVPLYRREFKLSGEVQSARVYASALGLYELSLNGHRVGELYLTPGWTSYRTRLQYQTYDVTSLLREGGNALGAMVGNGWYKGRLTWVGFGVEKYGSRTALFAELHVTYRDGRTEVITTDGSWKTAAGPISMSEIYDGETFDANLEPKGWDQPGFDDRKWCKVHSIDIDKSILVAQENEPVRAIQTVAPVRIFRTPKGETVLDMGQNMVGLLKFHADGPKDSRAQLIHFETLDSDGNVYLENLRSAKQTVTYTHDGAARDFTARFTYQGFRYVWIKEFPREPKPEDFIGIVLHSGMEETGSFVCSDELVNQLQHNILWSQKGNFVDVPTDCPQRDERLGWTGDAEVFCATSLFNMNTALFFKKWLHDLKADQLPNGGVPHIIPQVLHPEAHSSSAWGDAAVICPWTVYQCTGDRNVLEEQYESMKAWIGFVRGTSENGLIWRNRFHFGDWVALDSKEGSYLGATPQDFIATIYYANSADIVRKTAALLHRPDDEAYYKKLHKDIVKAFREEFVTPTGRIVSGTQTAQILALHFGMLREKDVPRAVDTLIEKLKQTDWHLETGFLGTAYICHVLSRYGHTEAAYRLLMQTDFPSWLYQVKAGATTIWEHWDGIKPDGSFWSPGMNSLNQYAYGAIGSWLYQTVAGINTDEAAPGYRHIRLAPKPGVFTFAKAAYRSPYGEIKSGWKLEDGFLTVDVTVPANTTASLILPGAKPGDAESEKATPVTDGLQLELGSGAWSFRYPFEM